jgi:hypothetical protein
MGVRRQTAEHPFGTTKCWMGATHFLTKELPKVATETVAQRARLQHEARDGDQGRRRIVGGNAGVRPISARPNHRLHEALGCN